MPYLVKTLLVKLRHAEEAQERSSSDLRSQVAALSKRMASQEAKIVRVGDEYEREAEAAEAKIARLEGELKAAKEREGALMNALAMFSPREGAVAAAGAK